jgi:hypothetical protein
MSDVRVFASFDVVHDRDLGDLLSEQSQRGGSGFEVSARSRKGAISGRWRAAVRRRIRDADEVIVICGEHTDASLQVDSELRIAQEEHKPYFLLWGRRKEMCTMPARATRSESMYSWSWEILLQQISETLRNAEPHEVPERYKRL